MLRAALTGGIATGKTHVLARCRARGAPTIDADELAREAVQPGSRGAAAIAGRFGPAVMAPDGSLDRKKLAGLVFADPAARRDLEAIVHPAVYEAIVDWFAALEASGTSAFGIADIPLLYETGHAADFDRVIVTACDPEEQVRRVMSRDGTSEEEARQRLAAQLPIEEKVRRAHFVVWTGGTIEETDRQVDELLERLNVMR